MQLTDWLLVEVALLLIGLTQISLEKIWSYLDCLHSLALESLIEGPNLFLNQFVGISLRSMTVCFLSLSAKAV